MSPELAEDNVSPSPPRTAPARDNDHSDEGYSALSHTFPPSSQTGQVPSPGRYTLAQSTRRRTTLRAPTVNRTNSVGNKTPSIPPGTKLQRFKTGLNNLVTPGHKVGDSPGFVRELKSILFGTCASRRHIWLQVPLKLMLGARVQRPLVGNTSLRKCFSSSRLSHKRGLIDG
jgi:hypothetical protein